MGSNSDSDSGSESLSKSSGRPFLIEVDGRFVTKPNITGEDTAEIVLGEIQDAATFVHAKGYLCCDHWFMGRAMIEPAAPMYFPINWCKESSRTQKVKFLARDGSTEIESNGRWFAFDPRQKALVSGEHWMISDMTHTMATVHWV